VSNEVYANGNAIACKAGDDKVIAAFPDVCLSPPSPPAGPVPVPYPNSSFSKDMQNGSRTVSISRQPVMLKNRSYYKTSPLGNEAATRSFGGSVVTHTITGKTYFVAWSMDVKIEGYNVDRHLDLTGSNQSSDPSSPPPVQPGQEQSSSGGGGSCPKCGKPNTTPGTQKPDEIKRVCGTDRNGAPLPKYQLRQGENGLSTFAGTIPDSTILGEFRAGSTIDTKKVADIESKGLVVVQTHGDCDHLSGELQDNHWEIQPGPGMDRNTFKKVLKTL
jgi:hypothetical protein